MKIQYISDVHGNYKAVRPDPSADLLVVAGDWSDGIPDLSILFRWPVPVVYVMGNHEYYRGDTEQHIASIRKMTHRTNVHFLEEDVWVYQGVRFVGCTGWTDFAHLHPWLLYKAWQHMTDYRKISAESWLLKPMHKEAFFSSLRKLEPHPYEAPAFHPLISHSKHVQARDFLDRTLSIPFNGPTVVVTHHPPSPRGLRHFGRWLPEPSEDMDFHKLDMAFPRVGWHRVGTYASRLDGIIREHQPTVWFHGHIHHKMTYFIDKTIVLTNAIGHSPKSDTIATVNVPQIPWWEKQNVLSKLKKMHSEWIQTSVIPSFYIEQPPSLWVPHVWRLHCDVLTEEFELGGANTKQSDVQEAYTLEYWRKELETLKN